MFPAKFGMKSTRDGNCRRRCRDRRVLVIPSLSLMDTFSPAKVIAAMKTVCVCLCVRECVWRASGLQTNKRASAAHNLFFSADDGRFL